MVTSPPPARPSCDCARRDGDAPLLDAVDAVASTTAWGLGDRLDVVLDRIATQTSASWVELAIGARPVPDPAAVLDRFADRFSYLAHHTVPVLPSAELRPRPELLRTAVRTLASLGIERYTVHPPHRKLMPAEAAMWDWAWRWHDTLADAGIAFRLETMYHPQAAAEHRETGGYHLDTPASVDRFCDQARSRGWDTPLLIDISHLHIGLHSGRWTAADVDALLVAGVSDHLHVSTNDGIHDRHAPVAPGDWVQQRVAAHLDRFTIVVDEARRRGSARRIPARSTPR